MSLPWDIHQARHALAESSRELAEAVKNAARAEETYRRLLAVQIVKEHDAGVAWSVASDVARGHEDVAAARVRRDLADGVREGVQQAGWRAAADRKDAQRLADWSQRQAFADGLNGNMDVQWSKEAA